MAEPQVVTLPLAPLSSVEAGASAAAGAPLAPVSAALGVVPKAYFEEAAGVAGAVFERGAFEERCYAFGRLTCCIRYADADVYGVIHRAFLHLEVPRRAAELSIGVWSAARARHALPAPHEIMLLYYRNHCLALCSDARYLALDERWLGAKSFVDRDAGVAWYCLEDVGKLPYYQRAAPLRSVLNALLGPRRAHLVHAAAVGSDKGGLLLPGASGAGKSSTALTCLGGELAYLADDWCGVDDADAPELFSVYNSAKLCPDNLERFPELRGCIAGNDVLDREKATLFVAEHFPDWVARRCVAKAILLPEVSGEPHTTIVPAPRKEAWKTLVTWTLSQTPGCDPSSLAASIGRLTSRLPVFRLKLGHERARLRAALERFLDES